MTAPPCYGDGAASVAGSDGRAPSLLHDPSAKRPLCKRDRTSKSRTPSQRSGPYLHFVYPNDTRSPCCSCRNMARQCCKGAKLGDIAKTLQDVAKQRRWDESVRQFQDAFESTPPGGRIRNAAQRFLARLAEGRASTEGDSQAGLGKPPQRKTTNKQRSQLPAPPQESNVGNSAAIHPRPGPTPEAPLNAHKVNMFSSPRPSRSTAAACKSHHEGSPSPPSSPFRPPPRRGGRCSWASFGRSPCTRRASAGL